MVWPFARATDLLPGLLPASYRGVPLYVVDTSKSVGRRIATQFFPGTDLKAVEDRGLHTGKIQVSAFLIGDDYVAQAGALEAALSAPGPATYVCPWRGPVQVVANDGCDIKFSVKELRLARAQLDLEIVPAGLGAPGTLGGLLSAIAGGLGLVGSFAARLLGPLAAAAAVIAAVNRGGGGVATVAVETTARSRLAVRVQPRVEVLARPLVLASAETPEVIGSHVVALAAGTADLLAATLPPATAAAAGEPTPRDPRAGAALLLAIGEACGAAERPSIGEAAVLVAARAAHILHACDVAIDIAYDSRQDARSWRDRLSGALDGAARDAETLLPIAAEPALDLASALRRARTALHRDMAEIIGRLPAVREVDPRTPSAHVLAQAIAGDDPAAILPMVDDITRRNGLEHPGALPRRRLEVLS